MKSLLLLLLLLMTLNFGGGTGQALNSSSTESPDIIFLNGDIYTQASPARAQAMAVRDGRIVAIGSNDDIRKLKGEQTQIVDLGGHFVMPGFNDAHLHLAAGGLRLLEVDLVGVASLAEMLQRIADHARTTTPGDWIVGSGWDHTLWVSRKLPTRQDIDAVTGAHPAIFVRIDGHIAVANTAALNAAGMLSKIPIRPAARSIATPAARPPASFGKQPRTTCWRQRPSLLPRCDAVRLNSPWRTPPAGASPPRRTTPIGKTFWSTKSLSGKAS